MEDKESEQIPETPEELEAAMAEAEAHEFKNPTAPGGFMNQLRAQLPTNEAVMKQKALVRHREVEFTFDGTAGAPGFFMDPESGEYFDVKLGFRSLSSAQEIEALDGVKNPIEAPYALAKACLYAIDGERIKAEERDLIWEGLGVAGRQLCVTAQNALGAVSESAMGKYRKTFTVA